MMYHQVEKGLQNQEFSGHVLRGVRRRAHARGGGPEGELQGRPARAPTTASRKQAGMGGGYLRRAGGQYHPPSWPRRSRARKKGQISSPASPPPRFRLAGRCWLRLSTRLAFMHGVGTPGNYVGWIGMHEHGYSTTPYCFAGDASNGAGKNPAQPPCSSGNRFGSQLGRNQLTRPRGKRWITPNAGNRCSTELTAAIAARYKPLDIHVIYTGGYQNGLNSLPNANAGIKAFRKVDFVWGKLLRSSIPRANTAISFCPSPHGGRRGTLLGALMPRPSTGLTASWSLSTSRSRRAT